VIIPQEPILLGLPLLGINGVTNKGYGVMDNSYGVMNHDYGVTRNSYDVT
jgi:hypothetical protein